MPPADLGPQRTFQAAQPRLDGGATVWDFFTADGYTLPESRAGTCCRVVAFGCSEAAHRMGVEWVDGLAVVASRVWLALLR
jgi:hypothetical protein